VIARCKHCGELYTPDVKRSIERLRAEIDRLAPLAAQAASLRAANAQQARTIRDFMDRLYGPVGSAVRVARLSWIQRVRRWFGAE